MYKIKHTSISNLNRQNKKRLKRKKESKTLALTAIATMLIVFIALKGIDKINDYQNKVIEDGLQRTMDREESRRNVSEINEAIVYAEEVYQEVQERKRIEEAKRIEDERLEKIRKEAEEKAKIEAAKLKVREEQASRIKLAKVKKKTVPKAVSGNIPQIIKDASRKYGVSYNLMMRIARCESSLNPRAFNGKNKNGTWDAGLFQFNSCHGISKERLFDPYYNANLAASWLKNGTSPWNASKHCWNK